jgi:predicted nucleic-acid-binding protein
MEWVLESNYGAKRSEVLAALEEILGKPVFAFEDRATLEKAVELYRRGKADLSDLLISLKAKRHGARTTFTFDGVLSRLDDFSLLT